MSSHTLYDEHIACTANQTNLTKALASVSTAADKASSWLRRAFDDELAKLKGRTARSATTTDRTALARVFGQLKKETKGQ